MGGLRFRQIHLDFHTSPDIEGVGADFDKRHWQETLRKARVNSVTCFSKCHHGWSYHPTKVGRMHPHLKFNLLRAQMDACKEMDINVPIYISAGVDNVASREHPEWRAVTWDGRYMGWAQKVLDPGFHAMCFNTPYLDYLCAQIEEAARMFPENNGFFLDIIHQGQCCCRWCMDLMAREGLDPSKEEDRQKCADMVLLRYYDRATQACRSVNSKTPVFHNSGHITRGRRDILRFFSHLELESLPTGGWGYDHFPVSAKYCANLGLDYMGMTGKFHTTWGEFGGYKHPNALRYECAAMQAFGARCSVGDQLHPRGRLDESTYEIIGAAYREVEEREPWCIGAKNVADIGLLSFASLTWRKGRNDEVDDGAARVLLEGHYLFDVIDREMDFSRYKMVILPDEVDVDPALEKKLTAYLKRGGRLFLTGRSGLKPGGRGFLFNIPAETLGPSPFSPDYVLAREDLRPDFTRSPVVMYVVSQRIRVRRGRGVSLGQVFDPYFNRDFRHFCSHQHAPPKPRPSGYDAGVLAGNVLYLAHPVFTLYRRMGAVAYRQYIEKAMNLLLGDARTLLTNLPSSGRVSLTHQPRERRHILHLLYANTLNRGGSGPGGRQVEVIEDLTEIRDVTAEARLPKAVRRVTLEPQGIEIGFEKAGERVRVRVDRLKCHQMVVFHE